MTDLVLAARNVSLAYGKHAKPVVEGVSLDVQAGEKVAIVGESGSGKSTLAKALAGTLAPVSGSVEVHGRPWTDVRRKDPERRAVQMIFQDPYSSLNPTMTPLRTVSEAVQVVRGESRSSAPETALELLDSVGLSGEAILRLPRALSGGQLQRVSIARALACRPDVLIADEATASLDVSIQAQVIGLLAELVARHRMALIMISHDLQLTRAVADSVVVMREGRVVEAGSASDVFTRPTHEYTRKLLNSSLLSQPGG